MNDRDFFVIRALNGFQTIPLPELSLSPAPVGSLQRLQQVLNHLDGINTVTLDVFDTLLRRDVEPSNFLHRETSKYISTLLSRLGVDISFQRLCEWRQEAKAIACQKALKYGGEPEATLNEILACFYRLLDERLNVDTERILPLESLMEFEVEREIAHTSPMPEACELLTALRKRGIRVLLISDMHLQHRQLEVILKHHGLLEGVEAIYVSSDARRSKGSGGMFLHLIDCGIINVELTMHIGDHSVSDVLRPAELGIDSFLYFNAEEQQRRAELFQFQRMAEQFGDSSYLRQLTGEQQFQELSGRKIGYQRLGPIFTLFALDILDAVLRGSYREIFFLSRDGYLFQELYRKLREGLHLSQRMDTPEGRYLYLSRASIKSAALKENDQWQSIDQQGNLSKSAKMRKLVHDYLQQQEFFGTSPVMIVDIGWNGSILAKLEQLFDQSPQFPQVNAKLFGRRYGEQFKSINVFPGFAYDEHRHNPLESLINEARELFETVAASHEGTVYGYEEKNGEVKPLLADNSGYDRTLVESLQKGILDYCTDFIHLVNRFSPNPEALKVEAIIEAASLILGHQIDEHTLLSELQLDIGWGKKELVMFEDYLGKKGVNGGKANFDIQLTFTEDLGYGNLQHMFERIQQMIEHLHQGKQLIVYGVGTVTNVIAPLLIDRIAYFVDGNRHLHGQEYLGRNIYSPEKIMGESDGVVLVTPINRKSIIGSRLRECPLPVLYVDDFFKGGS